ncbi:hypothetical protein, partial [Archangium sp.]|uniref:hypothetical protein n=1 Tax=Archangium sp. TaxID=1872627 RepID=UPI002D75BF10
ITWLEVSGYRSMRQLVRKGHQALDGGQVPRAFQKTGSGSLQVLQRHFRVDFKQERANPGPPPGAARAPQGSRGS